MKPFIAFILLALSLNLFAATVDNITFPDVQNVNGRVLVLNGIGIRKATILKIKVYYGALYLEKITNNSSLFLNSPATKQIIMHFVRNIEAKKLQDAFAEGMEAANKNHINFKSQMDKFNAFITNAVKGEEFVITFLNDEVILNLKGKASERIAGTEFSHALLNIWFINARDESLRNGLLGL